MAIIKIEDLPVMEDLDADQAKGIFGGYTLSMSSFNTYSTATYFDKRAALRDNYFPKVEDYFIKVDI